VTEGTKADQLAQAKELVAKLKKEFSVPFADQDDAWDAQWRGPNRGRKVVLANQAATLIEFLLQECDIGADRNRLLEDEVQHLRTVLKSVQGERRLLLQERARLEGENEQLKQTWRRIADLGTTFAGGRRYDEWVRLGVEMDKLAVPLQPPAATQEDAS
jgi:hypothetical protein